MVEASLAHVIMLRETGALTAQRADRLLGGLLTLWHQWGDDGPGEDWRPRVASYPFDGTVEDPYYYLEQQLATACGISTAELDEIGRASCREGGSVGAAAGGHQRSRDGRGGRSHTCVHGRAWRSQVA